MKTAPYSLAAALLAALSSHGQPNLAFKKVVLTKDFVGEGVSVGDFNKDGKPDVASGPFLWFGPDFTRKVKYGSGADSFDPNQYSFFFMNQAPLDVNGDGWLDIPVWKGLGSPNWWLENPKNESGGWKQYTGVTFAGFESAGTYPLLKNGTLQLLTANSARQIGWAAVDPASPYAQWKFHPVGDGKGGWFYAINTHGLGMGDVNGDGRNDILANDAWFEQPVSIAGDPKWIRHDYDFHMDRATGWGGSQMYADDVDGDGDADVVASLDGHGWGLAWFEHVKAADGGITFTPRMIMDDRASVAKYGVAFSQLHSLHFADLDGDGRKDIVTGKRRWAHGPGGDPEPMAAPVVYAFLQTRGSGGTTFKPVLIDSSAGSGCRLEAAVDLNGDGYNDVVTASKMGVNAFLSTNRPPVATLPRMQMAFRRQEAWRLAMRFPGGIPGDAAAVSPRMGRSARDLRGAIRPGATSAGWYVVRP